MIIDDFNILGTSLRPAKAESVLIIDPNTAEPFTIALQSLEPVYGRNAQVIQRQSDFKLTQLATCHALEPDETFDANPIRELFGIPIFERRYHGMIITYRVNNVKRY